MIVQVRGTGPQPDAAEGPTVWRRLCMATQSFLIVHSSGMRSIWSESCKNSSAISTAVAFISHLAAVHRRKWLERHALAVPRLVHSDRGSIAGDFSRRRSPPEYAFAMHRLPISKLLRQSCLLQHRIRCVTRFDLAIDDKMNLGNRTAPNLVIPFARSHERAPSREQQPLEFRRETFHQAASSKRRVSSSNAIGLDGV